MFATLEKLIDRLCGRSAMPKLESETSTKQCRWVIDLPPRDAVRLGSFRTKEEALDYRREFIIRSIREVEPIELPF
jgi:hypothetical protein